MSDNKYILTISIPTYNRPKEIIKTLKTLIPQITKEIKLNILDDCSPEENNNVIKPYIDSVIKNKPELSSNITYIRRNYNIGSSPNITRSFEECESPWLWVPGDDDDIKPDAIQIILETIKKHPDAKFINFSTNIYQYTSEIITKGKTQMLKAMDFGNVLFMTAGIYNVPKFQTNLQVSYHFQQTGGPHTALLIYTIEDNDISIFSTDYLCKWNASTMTTHGTFLREHGFNKVMIYLLDLSIPHNDKVILNDKLLTNYVDPSQIFKNLYHKYKKDKDSKYFYYQQNDLLNKAIFFDTNFKRKLRNKTYKILSKYPKFIPLTRLLWKGLDRMLSEKNN